MLRRLARARVVNLLPYIPLCCVFIVGCTSAPRASTSASTSMRQWRASAAPSAEAPQRVEGFIALAISTSHTLRAQHALWKAQRARARAVDRWSDPIFTYGGAPLPIETRLGPNPHTFGVTQKMPWFGRIGAGVEAGAAQAKVARHEFDAAYLMVRFDVQALYWSIWALEKERQLIVQQQSLLDTMVDTVKGRVEAGGRPASKLSGLSLKRARLSARLHVLEVSLVGHKALLAQRVGQPALEIKGIGQAAAPPLPSARASIKDVVAQVPPPHIQALKQAIDVRHKQKAVDGFDRLPQLQFGVQWSIITQSEIMPRPAQAGRDALMVRVGVSVPLWSGATSAKLEASEAMVVHAQAQLAQALDVWRADLRAVDQRMHHIREHIELIERTLLPQARAHEALVRADYEAGRVFFEDVLTSAQALYTQRIELARRRAMLATLHAQWQLLIGQRDAESSLSTKVSP